MPMFRKKPTVQEAYQFIYDTTCIQFLRDWMGKAFVNFGKGDNNDAKAWLHVKTLEDGDKGEVKHVATEGDWIIKSVKGEFYPCKPEIFKEVYNEVLAKEKTLHNSDISGARKNVPDIEVYGNGDIFKLLSKASSKTEGWMKSTKAMEIRGVGCIVQVTTQQGDNIAEALTFVPGVEISLSRDNGKNNYKLIAI